MQKQLTLRLKPSEAGSPEHIRQYIRAAEAIAPADLTGYYIVKRSIDARSRQPWVNLTVMASIGEPFHGRPDLPFHFHDVHLSQHSVLIIGAGPAGLFAALELLQQGIKPVILERGKDVQQRRRDLAALNKQGVVDPDSNYCFGEGGAGTYSDGKLYTRSNKRGDISKVLQLLVHFGADEAILYESHPHIGTNKLPGIITAIREHIIACGGEVHFEEKVTDLVISGSHIREVLTTRGHRFHAQQVILATGHSARDIFELLHSKGIAIEQKPFALGVRVEHPQGLIDSIQYHCALRDGFLPPASYSLVEQVQGKGVFSFCMCPGGIIAPAATAPGEVVVNGWSPSKRNNPFANSGMVVEITIEDVLREKGLEVGGSGFGVGGSGLGIGGSGLGADHPLLLMRFQQAVEKRAFHAGGGALVAPAVRMTDMTLGKTSADLPACSYLPGVQAADLRTVLPVFIYERLRQGFLAFGKKMQGYHTADALVVATESRTSSPVRIPRTETFQHPQIANLYPCGEGAGYAGGIVSAAMDGEKLARAIAHSYK